MKTSVIPIIYLFIGVICIILMDQPYFWPAFISKALIIPTLMILFAVNIDPLINRLHRFIFAGLFFSWAGDVILEFSNNNGNMFVPGLVCFLLAHVMYLTVFLITPGKNWILSTRFYFMIPVIIYGIALIRFLYDDLAEMRLPVILYAIVILAMLSAAINRKEKAGKVSYWLVLCGAILFVISDSAIAINKFSFQFESSGVVIMSTYIAAQYLIVTGYIYQFRNGRDNQIIR